jgi:hypothetical protein
MSNSAYNTFDRLPQMSYKIIEHLVLNNEDLWKMLKYDTSDCLDKPNLTLDQKTSLIYPGDGKDGNAYRVFMDYLIDDFFNKQCSLIRVYPVFIVPQNRVVSDITFCIEALSHCKITQLNNYTNRNVYMLQQIIKTLNGRDVNGVGMLSFDKMGNPSDKALLNISNNRNYQGYSIYMSTHTSTIKE